MASPSVILHPLVLLSIQDHAARAAKGTKKRVIGILLGSESAALGGGRTLNVVNSFAGQSASPVSLVARAGRNGLESES